MGTCGGVEGAKVGKRNISWSSVLLTLGLALAIFSWWGMFTQSGNRAFDEMAGMIPVAAGLVAGLLLLGGLACKLKQLR